MTGDVLLANFLFRHRDLPLSVKMPSSPDTLIKNTTSATNGSLTGVNGSHSPHPPGDGGTPSPPTSGADGGTRGGTRALGKVKRFLATLRQFASDLSVETGDRVHSLIIGLVSSSLSVEDFHHKIQEITNYPLRPFAVPFLKSHLPLLQAELVHFARLAKQSPQQYLRQHEHALLDSLSGSEPPFEIFQDREPQHNGKRRSPLHRNGKLDPDYGDLNGDLPPAKRHQIALPPSNSRTSPTSALPPGLSLRLAEEHAFRDGRLDRYERLEREFYRPLYGHLSRDFVEDREMDEEWRNIHTMLSCILGMVEKTKRALCILQHRAEFSGGSVWAPRPPSDPPDPKKIASHFRRAEDRVTEARRRAVAEEVEAKRQELQRVAALGEGKMAGERYRLERLLAEARRQAAEDALALATQQEEATENCWNCGRKASETCSGCNIARYCGSFCQHKDWESHHRVCGQSGSSSSGPPSVGTPPRTTADHSPSPPRINNLIDVKPPIKLDNM
ncbi:protein CBFA2T3-like [Uloborus diversus]|uniref:protein CBFA2T3-like n=1 Tax=Uloborus diversus TaxID=327109 RepID=UPI00240943C2|nr:protein CBFA2T3-like [Uloborus diversus]